MISSVLESPPLLQLVPLPVVAHSLRPPPWHRLDTTKNGSRFDKIPSL